MNNAANDNYPVVTAAEALAQGLSPAALLSVATFNERAGNMAAAIAARAVGRDMARIVGMDLGGRRKRNNKRRAA
jgi:2,3-bisphosphoglycerate-independent phosphoglycerate mutase